MLVAAAVHPGAVGRGRAAVGRRDRRPGRPRARVRRARAAAAPRARPARPAAARARRPRRSRWRSAHPCWCARRPARTSSAPGRGMAVIPISGGTGQAYRSPWPGDKVRTMPEPVLATQPDPAPLGGASRGRAVRDRVPHLVPRLLGRPRAAAQPAGLPARVPLRDLLGHPVHAADAARHAQRAGQALPARAPRGAATLTDDASELFPVLDAEGRQIGSAPRAACHADPSLIHPSVHVVVMTGERLPLAAARLRQGQRARALGSRLQRPREPRRGRAHRRGARARRGDRRRSSSPRALARGRPRALRARQRDRADDGLPARARRARSRVRLPEVAGLAVLPRGRRPEPLSPSALLLGARLDAEHPGWDR